MRMYELKYGQVWQVWQAVTLHPTWVYELKSKFITIIFFPNCILRGCMNWNHGKFTYVRNFFNCILRRCMNWNCEMEDNGVVFAKLLHSTWVYELKYPYVVWDSPYSVLHPTWVYELKFRCAKYKDRMAVLHPMRVYELKCPWRQRQLAPCRLHPT